MSARRELLLFMAIGGFAAGLNFIVRFPIDYITGFETAVVLAYVIAMTAAFLLNRAIVFKATDGAWLGQYRRFFMVNLLALAQVFVVTVALARFLFPFIGFEWQAEAVAHAIGLASPILTSYWGHKRYSFAAPKPASPEAA